MFGCGAKRNRGWEGLNRVAMVVWNEFLNDARVLKEAETLQSVGHQVTVHALHTPGVTSLTEILASGVKVVRVARSPFQKRRKVKGAFVVSGQLKKSGPIKKITLPNQLLKLSTRLWTHAGLVWQMFMAKPDVVHAHDVNTLPTAWLAAVLTGSPLVYDAHEISTDREGYSSFRSLVAYVEKHLMPRAAGTITTTDTRAKFFARAYGVPRPLVLQNRPRLIVVERSQRIRDELKLEQPWPIILYQGGLQQGRGLDRLVEAAAQVEGAYFVFIGGGRLEALLKDRVRTLELERRVHFIPTVSLEDLPHYTTSADIGVQPIENTCLNHFSTDSNKLFEYMMAGLPIVASSLPEIRSIVQENDLGLLVEAGDAIELASAINCLVENDAMRKRYGENASNAAKLLNWEEQEDKLISLYKRILK